MEWLRPSRCVERSNWHFWFAWYPVTVKTYPDGAEKKVWLQKVLRKGTLRCGMEGCFWTYKYKETTND
jgi:hypothetical protein